ncbi:MAG: hypothetical protein GY847_29680 [Proteobacteria bacterium]|nr:hypothetical protein [Pseudomonadota bacterium]
MRIDINRWYLLLFAVFTIGCSSDDDSTELDTGEDTDNELDAGKDTDDAQKVAFATYNAGLAVGFVDYADERQPLIAEGLAGLTADVVCLQEVWLKEQIDALVKASETSFPYAYYEITEDDKDAGTTERACSEEEVEDFGGCVRDNCGEIDPGELADCALEKCAAKFAALSPECITCVSANIGKTIDEILDACSGSDGGTLAYEGHNGLMILSKLPFKEKDFLILESYLNRRVVLHARITTEVLQTVDLFCTHLTANLEDVNYAGGYESWEDERATQIDTMLDFIAEKSGAENSVVLMGDTNCGPKTKLATAEYPDHFQKFVKQGFNAPYADDSQSPCTWCDENPLTGGADSGGLNSILDHIFFAQTPQGIIYDIQRIMDNAVSFESGGITIESRMSDHYGVEVEATN